MPRTLRRKTRNYMMVLEWTMNASDTTRMSVRLGATLCGMFSEVRTEPIKEMHDKIHREIDRLHDEGIITA